MKQNKPEKSLLTGKGNVISTSGKGGVGKTSFIALVLKTLVNDGVKDILIVDADPDSNIPDVLAVEVTNTIATIVNELLKKMSILPSGIDKPGYIEGKIFENLYESSNFDLLVMGALEREGCFCYINRVLTDIIDTFIKNYTATLIDMPAGLEHIARRTAKDVEFLYILTDTSKMGLQTAQRIKNLAEKVQTDFNKVFLVLNRGKKDTVKIVADYARKAGLEYVGHIPEDPLVAEFNLLGKSLLDLPEDSKAYLAVREIVEKTLILR